MTKIGRIEQLQDRLATLCKECEQVSQFHCLGYASKQAVIDWYEHEIECCKTALEREGNK